MHQQKVIHRDLKPSNILIIEEGDASGTGFKLCIADFGLAYHNELCPDKRELAVECGTPSYIDPYLLNGGSSSPSSDIFSLGSIFFNMFSARLLYPGLDANRILYHNRHESS